MTTRKTSQDKDKNSRQMIDNFAGMIQNAVGNVAHALKGEHDEGSNHGARSGGGTGPKVDVAGGKVEDDPPLMRDALLEQRCESNARRATCFDLLMEQTRIKIYISFQLRLKFMEIFDCIRRSLFSSQT
jgi:hypothetical protein